MFWVGLSLYSIPIFFPITADEKGLTGLQVGIVVALKSLVSIIATPFVECITAKTSSEFTILIGLITTALGHFALAFTI